MLFPLPVLVEKLAPQQSAGIIGNPAQPLFGSHLFLGIELLCAGGGVCPPIGLPLHACPCLVGRMGGAAGARSLVRVCIRACSCACICGCIRAHRWPLAAL